MRRLSGLLALGFTIFASSAFAQDCSGKLGVERDVALSVADGPVGKASYRKTVALQPMEVVLTFDDGPVPGRTPAVLEALKAQCTLATFFVVGTMVAQSPELLQRIASEHHTIGTHTWQHHYLPRQSGGAEDQITGGVLAAARALGPDNAALTPFFRFPGLERNRRLDAFVQDAKLVSVSVDVDADDWRHISPQQVLSRALNRLEENKGGILLLHDIQARTVTMLPDLLVALKERGFKVVHLVPQAGETASALATMSPPDSRRIQTAIARIPAPAAPMAEPAMAPVASGAAPASLTLASAASDYKVIAVLDPSTLGLRGSSADDLLRPGLAKP